MYRLCIILLIPIQLSSTLNDTDVDEACDCSCSMHLSVINCLVDELKAALKRVAELEKRCKGVPSTCLGAMGNSSKSGIYKIQVKTYSNEPFAVFCDEGAYESAEGGGWTVIQRRVNGSVDFNRPWNDYKKGFGNLTGNYWIGLDKLHAITNSCEHELYIVLQRFKKNDSLYAKYEQFVIADEKKSYALTKLGNYNGTAGDSLKKKHSGMKFSTSDRDNDLCPCNCAKLYAGGWWFNNCYQSNLNGDYNDHDGESSVSWITINKKESLKFVQMMIRPTESCIKRLKLIK